MSRQQLSRTTANPKATKGIIPYIEQFLSLVSEGQNIVSTRELHTEYMCYLRSKTTDENLMKLGRQFKRFAMYMKNYAIKHKWKLNSHGLRGYFIDIRRNQRKYYATENHTNEQCTIERKFISRVKGYGAFAKTFIIKGTFICQYHGQLINKQESLQREICYSEQNLCPTMYKLSENEYCDGYKNQNGNSISIEENQESLAVKITEEHIRASINKICCSDECPVRLWSSPNVIEDVKTNRIHHLSISQGNDRTNNLLSLMRSTGMRQDTKLFHNFHGTRVCKTKWSQLLGISMHTYYRGMILIKKGFVQIEQVNGIEKRSIKGMDDIGFIIHAIHMYGDQSPERDRIELPACISKKSIYEEYLELPIEHVMDKHFYRLFQEYFGDKVSFGKFHNINPCDICIKGKEDLSKTTDPEMKIALKKTLKEHLDRQRQERLSYYDRRGNAITRPDKFMSVIIDGMDQAKTNLPHFRGWSRPKAAYPVLKTHITGVILHGLQTKFYLDILQWPHDPNLTMTCLLKSIRDHLKDGCLPETLYIQCDNCGRENKNRYILGFLAVLCRLGYVKEVILSFLMKGHTHEDIDQRFSKISSRLLKNNAKTILQLQDEIRKTFLNESKVEILGTCWDVKSWLNGSVSDVHNHSYPHQFWFYADTPGHVAMKTRLWSTEEWMPNDEQAPLEILRMDDNGNQLCPSGNPPRIAPSYEKCNFNVQRSLIEKMKIHLSEEEYNWWQNFFEKPDSISGGEDIWCLQDIRRIHRMETIPLAINNIETSLTPLMENERSCREVYTGRLQRNYNRKQ